MRATGLLIWAVGAVGCAEPAPPAAAGPALAGTSWTAVAVDGRSLDPDRGRTAPAALTLRFGDRPVGEAAPPGALVVSGNRDCNGLGGLYVATPDSLRFHDVWTHLQLCRPAGAGRPDTLLHALVVTATWAVRADTLRLADGAGRVRLVLAPS